MPTNLPTVPNAFIGRESDLDELLRLLMAVRVVTLCGTGGIGKTRLCLSVAHEAVEVFSDGVWLVELADLDSGALLAERVASVLGVQVAPEGDPSQAVAAAVGGGKQLLVLDNCEHLIEHCAELCTYLLGACPDLRVLATSREPLRVAGETVWRVPPLSLLPVGGGGSDAVRLFVDRSVAGGGLTWTAQDDAAVSALCAELEGIPLAIELAAAMTRVLSVEQIRSRLSDRFKLLTSGSRSAPARQRTLLATVEWSYRMLSAPAQLLLQRLTVFRGGWTLEFAELTCPCPGLAADEVLVTMAELVDKSLVLADGEAGGEARYRMLDTVRDYARQRLQESGEEEELRLRHLECIGLVARRLGDLIATCDRRHWPEITRRALIVDAMQPNLYAALGHARRTGLVERGMRICTDLQWVIVAGGRFDEAARHIDALLEKSATAAPDLVAHTLAVRSLVCFFGGDVAGVERNGAAAIRLGRVSGNPVSEAFAMIMMCAVGAEGDGLSLGRAAELAQKAGDRYVHSLVIYVRALQAQAGGQIREAVRLYEQMIECHRDANDWGMALAVIGLAQIAAGRGDLEAAARHYQYAQELLDPLDHRGERIRCLTGLGRVAAELGDFDTARRRLAESLALSSGLGQRAVAVELVDAFADLALRQGEHARAVRLMAAASALRERMGGALLLGMSGAKIQELLAPARRTLGETLVAQLWAEGRTLPWHQALDYAVRGEPQRPPSLAAPPAVTPYGTLTEREREIAGLIARGLSNRKLAEELVISPATVARHVSNILAKLGFTSRTQVATWAIEHGMNG
ncbi:LuxR C-terminal-related transcriptional regulator [Nonomuraea typhae]|uniref:LuxR C-terminal-related transcriptional regulator n=1 Tax=Nonomuraea typhae TaxID=2603600 RepID=UPI0015E24E25|nr:LuxR C-terminal-related transcriptional regulator [Nonomuraea typhae]